MRNSHRSRGFQHPRLAGGDDDHGRTSRTHRLLPVPGGLGGALLKGRPVRLLVLLGVVTTVVSMFLDNVTTVVLIAPVTILICEILGISPSPFLITEALLSNTGGVATLVAIRQHPHRLGCRLVVRRFPYSFPADRAGGLADGASLLRFLFRRGLPKNREHQGGDETQPG